MYPEPRYAELGCSLDLPDDLEKSERLLLALPVMGEAWPGWTRSLRLGKNSERSEWFSQAITAQWGDPYA